MTPLQIALLAVTLLMVVRQAILIVILTVAVNKVGRVNIRYTWWLHLLATIGLVVASIVSFTGISA